VLPEIEEWRQFYLADGGQRKVRDYLALMPSTPVSMLMQEFGFHGPAMNVSAMCASGNAGADHREDVARHRSGRRRRLSSPPTYRSPRRTSSTSSSSASR
jgi:hypothetical protein